MYYLSLSLLYLIPVQNSELIWPVINTQNGVGEIMVSSCCSFEEVYCGKMDYLLFWECFDISDSVYCILYFLKHRDVFQVIPWCCHNIWQPNTFSSCEEVQHCPPLEGKSQENTSRAQWQVRYIDFVGFLAYLGIRFVPIDTDSSHNPICCKSETLYH